MTISLDQEIDEIVAEITPELIAIRRHLHAYPELSTQEFETSQLVCDKLDELGVTYKTGFATTGVAAVIGEGNGKLIGIRGDMDALPIQEESGAPYASTRAGISHACGHDAHTAIALGVAKVMARLGSRLPGKAMVIFQPAEEGFGGAADMIKDGVLEWNRPAAILGYHNWPLLPAGTIGWHPVASFASSDVFKISVRGVSGHGAHPHLARDPIVAAAQFIIEAQTIVSREIAPLDPAVVSFGSISGGSAANQIPDLVTLTGTARSQSSSVRATIKAALGRIAGAVSVSHRVSCEIEFGDGVASVINDPEILAVAVEAAIATLGKDNVITLPQGSMGSEDFSEFSERVPSAHLRIGSMLPDRQTMLHRSNFDLHEDCIAVAVRSLSRAAIRLMAE